MKLNCKPGDLAVYIKSNAGNEGKIVRCVRLATSEEIVAANFRTDEGPLWITDRPLPTRLGRMRAMGIDARLRPIRDPGDDAVDESHAWLPPVPHKEIA